MGKIDILKASTFCLGPEGFWGLPLLMWGDPGVGKTAMLTQVSKMFHLPFYRISPAERGEGQFGVVPVPGADGFLHYPPPDWASVLKDGGILFVDEINRAVEVVKNALLGLVQLRTLGSHTFCPRVRVFGAANEPIDAGGMKLDSAGNNRFGHLQFDGLPTGEWLSGFVGGFGGDEVAAFDPAEEEKRVLAAWPTESARARGLVAGFIQRKPDMLHQKPPKGSSIRAWASRRSVEYVACALASSAIQGLTEMDADEFASSFVGAPWFTEFATWRANADLPDPVAVVDGKVTFKHDLRRLDRTMAVLSACVGVATGTTEPESRKARAGVCWGLIEGVLKDSADVAVPAARLLVRAKLIGGQVPNAKAVLIRIQPVLAAAGINAV